MVQHLNFKPLYWLVLIHELFSFIRMHATLNNNSILYRVYQSVTYFGWINKFCNTMIKYDLRPLQLGTKNVTTVFGHQTAWNFPYQTDFGTYPVHYK